MCKKEDSVTKLTSEMSMHVYPTIACEALPRDSIRRPDHGLTARVPEKLDLLSSPVFRDIDLEPEPMGTLSILQSCRHEERRSCSHGCA